MIDPTWSFAGGVAGVAAGLTLLWRGLRGYRAAARIGDTSTSRIATLAAGEVRVTGAVESAEALLVSPLQSRPCVWYRASVSSISRDDHARFDEERGVGFRVRDASGSIRVFPRGARIDVPDQFDERAGAGGEPPPGYEPRRGPAFTTEAPADREAAIAALLTVHPVEPDALADLAGPLGRTPEVRWYREARLEPGDTITVVGSALPFGQLEDPSGADLLDRYDDPLKGLADPVVAAEVEAARAAGTLRSPEEAWGNAAIPGFGIGHPVRAPELDPRANPEAVATSTEAAEIERRFDILPDQLVLAAAPGAPLLLAAGSPGEAVARDRRDFQLGLLGAALAIVSAIVAALAVAAR